MFKELFSKLTIIDKYILKRYLATFSIMLLLFIPIGITIDVAEKINKILENKVPFAKVASYYLDFIVFLQTIYFLYFYFFQLFGLLLN